MASSGDKLVYFLIGSFVGACAALLLAPQSGEETRDMLEGKAREGADKVGQRLREGREALEVKGRDLADRASKTLDREKEVLRKKKEQLGVVLEAAKRSYKGEPEAQQESAE
jgi:gas vesicle protein